MSRRTILITVLSYSVSRMTPSSEPNPHRSDSTVDPIPCQHFVCICHQHFDVCITKGLVLWLLPGHHSIDNDLNIAFIHWILALLAFRRWCNRAVLRTFFLSHVPLDRQIRWFIRRWLYRFNDRRFDHNILAKLWHQLLFDNIYDRLVLFWRWVLHEEATLQLARLLLVVGVRYNSRGHWCRRPYLSNLLLALSVKFLLDMEWQWFLESVFHNYELIVHVLSLVG